jgi:hypothetical protein
MIAHRDPQSTYVTVTTAVTTRQRLHPDAAADAARSFPTAEASARQLKTIAAIVDALMRQVCGY